MSLSPGQKIGSYEVVSLLGAGGMGEVYRARDTRLKRDVAIKVLPDDVAADQERLARFQREAEVLASLNHPHIAQIYGLEELSGPGRAGRHSSILVLELVEGEDLSKRIFRGPIPIDEALPIARQIAEALEAAHDHGVIHRDLKPANITIREDGTVKVLDFGLAKALDPVSSAPLANSPTITSPAMTMRGVVLGTAAYMAPEQAKGKAVDRRADIWAFGCVLYEMLTGRRTFKGDDVSDTLVSILRDDPRWAALPPDTPPHVRLLLRRCLQRDPQKRLPHIGAARLDLAEGDTGELTRAVPARSSRWMIAGGVVAGAIAAAVIAYLLWPRIQPGTEQPPVRFAIDAPLGTFFPGANNIPRFSIAPDGRTVAVQVQDEKESRLWLRTLDSMEGQTLDGTAGDRAGLTTQQPFWSPDGRYLAFLDGLHGELKKLDRTSGLVQMVHKVPGNQLSGSWNDDNIILFSSAVTKGIQQVPASGGTASAATTIDSGAHETAHLWPDFLPDGRHFVYLTLFSDGTPSAVFIGSLDGEAPRRLFESTGMARVMWPDRLLFPRGGALVSQRIDLDSLAMTGEPQLVARGIPITPNGRIGVSTSRNGVLVYAPGTSDREPFDTAWLDRLGQPVAAAPPSVNLRGLNGMRLSRDGRSLAYVRALNGSTASPTGDLWVQDLTRGIETRLNASTITGAAPVFSPDGSQLVSRRANTADILELYLLTLTSNASPEVLFTANPSEGLIPLDWTPDGKQIVFQRGFQGDERGFWVVNVSGDRKASRYLEGTGRFGGALSPNGRFFAHAEGAESEGSQIFVHAFPDASKGKWTISAPGGTNPRWSPDGKEIFFIDRNRRLMSVSFSGDVRVEVGAPRMLFAIDSWMPLLFSTWSDPFDVMPDGQRFVVLKSSGAAGSVGSHLIVELGNRHDVTSAR